MKNIVLLTLFLLLTSSTLSAYSKKIIFSAFSNEKNANTSLEDFKKTSQFTRLNQLSRENNFKVYVRDSGKYFVVVAEPIYNKKVGIESFNLVKSNYKSAYTRVYEKLFLEKKVVEKKIIETKIVKVVEIKKIIEKKEELKKDINETILPVTSIVKEINSTKEIVKEVKKEILEIKNQEVKVETSPEKMIVYKKVDDKIIDVWSVVRYVVIFFFLFVVTFYYIKFKRLYEEY